MIEEYGYRGLRPLVCAIVFLTGFVSFGYEVVMQAEAVIYLGSSNIAMGVVISMFILGYLSSLLFGMWADRLRKARSLIVLFISLELLVGLTIIFLGDILSLAPAAADGLSSLPLLGAIPRYTFLLIFVSLAAVIVPALMGGEMPIAMKLLSGTSGDAYGELGRTTGVIFTLDSLGSALGGVITSVFLLETLGKNNTALLVGLLSVSVVLIFGILWGTLKRSSGKDRGGKVNRALRRMQSVPRGFIKRHRTGLILLFVLAAAVSTLIVNTAPIKYGAQQETYQGIVVYHRETPFNNIAVTEHLELDYSLFLNRKLVLSEGDYFQQYEPMVHVPMSGLRSPGRVLIFGGNGGALAEVLKYPSVKEVVVVEKDPVIIEVARQYFAKVQNNAFDDGRVIVNHSFPREFLLRYRRMMETEGGGGPGDGGGTGAGFDCVIIDLLEPRSRHMALNYTVEFYENVSAVLRENGIAVTHASSPIFTPETAVVIGNSMRAAIGPANLFGTDIWSSGPYLFCMASRNSSSLKANDTLLRENFGELTDPTRLYTPANHEAFLLMARTNRMLELTDMAIISTDPEHYVEPGP